MELTPKQLSLIITSLRTLGESGAQEKRRFTRVSVQAAIAAAELGGDALVRRWTALTRDVSAGGIGVLQSTWLQGNVMLLLALPFGDEMFHVIGQVVFCRPLADRVYTIGARFIRTAEQGVTDEFNHWGEAQERRIQRAILS